MDNKEIMRKAEIFKNLIVENIEFEFIKWSNNKDYFVITSRELSNDQLKVICELGGEVKSVERKFNERKHLVIIEVEVDKIWKLLWNLEIIMGMLSLLI